MQLGNAYTTMDREYHSPMPNENFPDVSQIGSSLALGIAAGNVRDINSNIMAGAGNLEITFSGIGKGSQQQQTPGIYGKEEREAIRELSQLNKVGLSTHSSFGLFGMSGFGDEGFSEQKREASVKELKKTIDFAKDTAEGGAIVIHTGEFPRPIATQDWAKTEDGYMFKAYKEEPEKAVEYLVDSKTGKLTGIKRDTEFRVPQYHKTTEGAYVNVEGDVLEDQRDITKRVPVWDEGTGKFLTEKRDWTYFEEQANEYNKGRSVEEQKTTAEYFFLEQDAMKIMQAEGSAKYYTQGYDQNKRMREQLVQRKALDVQNYQNLPDDEKQEFLAQTLASTGRESFSSFMMQRAKEGKDPLGDDAVEQLYNKKLRELDHQMAYMNESAASTQAQADQLKTEEGRIQSVERYAMEKSINSFAEAGIYAMQQSQNPEKPLFVALEQIYPEQYGGHPEELKTLIFKSRDEMEKRLMDKGYGETKAHELAEEHIKGTFDTAHVNLWYKYYQEDEDRTPEENKAEFNKWVLNQAEELAKSGVIGNIHISDNFGYEDDHLNPGMGNAPWKEIMEIFKKHGYEGKYIVEPGKEGVMPALTETWAQLGSPVYSAYRAGAAVDTWTDVRHSYFGRTGPPNYLVGQMVPSQDWTLWSGVPLE